MAVKAVLFDLDGTLLPMDQDHFVKYYFGMLARKMAPYGYEPEKLVNGIWTGMAAMVKNDGTRTNEAAFWQAFSAALGPDVLGDKYLFEEFYANEFERAREACGYTPKAAAIVETVKGLGCRVALATNPIFPAIATQKRIRWAGLEASDFEMYTTYENSRFCKPNLDYYRAILKDMGLEPADCLMVGNDVAEDMIARELGMQVFLLTGSLINKENRDIGSYPHGDFDDLEAFLLERAGAR